jgi:hypothetical protein
MRRIPEVGMEVRIVHLGRVDHATIEAVLDDGRTLIVAGQRFTLRPVNALFVRDGEGAYGTRIVFGGP